MISRYEITLYEAGAWNQVSTKLCGILGRNLLLPRLCIDKYELGFCRTQFFDLGLIRS